ncbi:MAG: DUF2157 domain-containing protein [Oceanicaulis sp.]
MAYRKRLERDLDRWIEKGLVPADNRAAILADIAPAAPRWNAAGAAAILGAVLLAFAAISFVAANWAELPRLARFAVIIGALWASLGGAAFAFARNNTAIGHALALLGAALFGAAIALTAQTFNMSAFRNTGILIWTVGALVTAIAVPSRPVLILAALLGGFWAALESNNPLVPGVAWGYVPVWIATLAAAIRLESKVAIHLLAAAAIVWTGWTVYETTESTLEFLQRNAVYTLIAAAAAMVFALLKDRGVLGAGILSAWFAVFALVAGFGLQSPEFLDDREAETSAFYLTLTAAPLAVFLGVTLLRLATGKIGKASAGAYALAGLAALIMPIAFAAAEDGWAFGLELLAGAAVYGLACALIFAGAGPGRGAIGVIGVVLFVAQTLYVYGRLFGDLLNTAVFFFVGGLVLFGVSMLLARVSRRLAAEGEARS